PLFHLIQTYPFQRRRSTRGGALVATHRLPFLLRPTSPLALPLLFSHLAAPEAAGSAASPTHPSLSCPISHSSCGSSWRHLRRMIQATSGESRHREAQPELPSHRGTLPSGYIQHLRPPKPTRDPLPMDRVSGILSSPMAMPSSSRPMCREERPVDTLLLLGDEAAMEIPPPLLPSP
uniref:Uncharacterized protein n=1 Tax=Triticum urartu TaxID=4572 RepID=A0A8R7UZS4_TRIUA